ncbi:hypothetical protein [Janthinobacterium fluminis]|uniref:Uncharacterized protein n=1 Tax=Janthinobacterium fluminis TaxID=2987524 RepID=A0ABT5JZM5_9BURK|nr:hypothetical protein [Janthinobacterium fluminis]MDC8756942.1 hypothetical protein [Janthinobacterium fluminis]
MSDITNLASTENCSVARLYGVTSQQTCFVQYMYLLEFIYNRLDGDKLLLARKLMYRPWACDPDLLAKHVPGKLPARFAKTRRYCAAIITPEKAPRRFFRLCLRHLTLCAYVVAGRREVIPADARMFEMQEAFVGQAIEDLASAGISFRALPAQDQAAFVSLYALAWCCVCCMAGIFVPFCPKSHYQLACDEDLKEALRLYWFGHHWSFQSNIADLSLREAVVSQLQSSGAWLERAAKAHAPAFQWFVTNTLDKYVSFHEDFSSLIYAKDKKHYEAIYRKTELICYFYLKSYENSKTLSIRDTMFAYNAALPHDYAIAAVHAAGFSQDELGALLEESENKGEGEALIVRSGPDNIRMGLLGLKYAISSYLKPMLVAMKTRGDWFDKKYIPAYLKQRVEDRRFRFGPEVKPSSDKEGKYDIDLLVADEQLGRLYFCQIKHRVATLLPHFRDEFDEYTRNKQLDHAVDQLMGTKAQFGKQIFVDKLRKSLQKAGASPAFIAKVDTAFLERSTGFIVIHTIENLDFAVKDGIAFYEWNTFRNLVRGQITVFTKESATVMAPDLRGLALDDPNRLSSALMAWSATHGDDNPLHPDKQWFYALNSHFQMEEAWDIKLWNRRIGSFRGASLAFPIM